MLTSMRLAPPRTWSSATATAPVKSPDSIRRRNRADPVTLVRSPMTTKLVSGPISNASRPLNRVRAARLGTFLAGIFSTALRIWRTCSGPVPQQPPAAFRNPLSANSLSSLLVMGGSSS